MSVYYGVRPVTETIRHFISSNLASGARGNFDAPLDQADISIFKDGSLMTLDASTITFVVNPTVTSGGTTVGLTEISVVQSNDADFAAGSFYQAVLHPTISDETVDSLDVSAVLFSWHAEAAAIEPATVTAITDGIKTMYGVIADSVNDGAATASSFTVTTNVGTDIRVGSLRLTSGDLSGESRLVEWTGTTVTVIEPTTVPAGLENVGPFSAGPANAVTFDFWPL